MVDVEKLLDRMETTLGLDTSEITKFLNEILDSNKGSVDLME